MPKPQRNVRKMDIPMPLYETIASRNANGGTDRKDSPEPGRRSPRDNGTSGSR